MYDIECSKPAYKKLQKEGLIERILNKRGVLRNILLSRDYFGGEGEIVLDWAGRTFYAQNRKISDNSESAKCIIGLSSALNERDGLDRVMSNLEGYGNDILLEHPAFLARLTLGEDVLRFRKFGFPTRKKLEEAVTSFCIGEGTTIMTLGDSYIWRNGDYKNEINLNVHGDFYASQSDVSAPSYPIETLFGEESELECVKRIEDKGRLRAHQDWSQFLISLLRYAEAIEMSNIHEIINWKSLLKEGCVGTNTAEAFGGTSFFGLNLLMDMQIMEEGKRTERLPLRIQNMEETFVPFIKNGKLLYLSERKREVMIRLGDDYGKQFGSKNYCVEIEYDEKDLPNALKATYRFFARDRSMLPAIMDYFIKNKKKL